MNGPPINFIILIGGGIAISAVCWSVFKYRRDYKNLLESIAQKAAQEADALQIEIDALSPQELQETKAGRQLLELLKRQGEQTANQHTPTAEKRFDLVRLRPALTYGLLIVAVAMVIVFSLVFIPTPTTPPPAPTTIIVETPAGIEASPPPQQDQDIPTSAVTEPPTAAQGLTPRPTTPPPPQSSPTPTPVDPGAAPATEDADGDGIKDNWDRCPQAGDAYGYGVDERGCPREGGDKIKVCYKDHQYQIPVENLEGWLEKGASTGACKGSDQ